MIRTIHDVREFLSELSNNTRAGIARTTSNFVFHEVLMKDPASNVRKCLAENSYISQYVICVLCTDSNPCVIEALAKNPKTQAAQLQQIFDSHSNYLGILLQILRNPHVTSSLIAQISEIASTDEKAQMLRKELCRMKNAGKLQ